MNYIKEEEDPRETTSSIEVSYSEYELEFAPNQLLHLHQTLTIYPRKVSQKPNFETQPKPHKVEPKMHSAPQDIANRKGLNDKTKQQDQHVDFNVSELNEEGSPDQFNRKRRVKNFTEVLDQLDQVLPKTSQQRVKKIIQLEGSEEFLTNDEMQAQATKDEATVIRAPDQRLRNITDIKDSQSIQNSQSTISKPFEHNTQSHKEKHP